MLAQLPQRSIPLRKVLRGVHHHRLHTRAVLQAPHRLANSDEASLCGICHPHVAAHQDDRLFGVSTVRRFIGFRSLLQLPDTPVNQLPRAGHHVLPAYRIGSRHGLVESAAECEVYDVLIAAAQIDGGEESVVCFGSYG